MKKILAASRSKAPFLCLIAYFLAQPLQAAPLDRASQAGLKPHKALYDIHLSSKKSSANIANISGKMVYEWQPSCDAWITTHHFDMLYEYVEMPAVRITSHFATHESFDSKEFNFTSERKREGVVFEEIRGHATVSDAPEESQAVYTAPDGLTFALPKGTLFPMAHTLNIVDSIKQNKKFSNVTLFDGSDEEGPVDVNSFIGREAAFVSEDGTQESVDGELLAAKGWNLRLAFFPLKEFSTTADYEMSVIFHENGVISDMLVEYSDFSVVQKLVAVEPLENLCENEQ